jgi:hypothetical protein
MVASGDSPSAGRIELNFAVMLIRIPQAEWTSTHAEVRRAAIGVFVIFVYAIDVLH